MWTEAEIQRLKFDVLVVKQHVSSVFKVDVSDFDSRAASAAVKVIEKDLLTSKDFNLEVEVEVEVLSLLASRPLTEVGKRVPQLLHAWEDEKKIFVAMPYLRGCQLQRLFIEFPMLDMAFIVDIAKQLVEIVQYLHEEVGIVHRDLKLSNVLVSPAGVVYLVDLGSAWPVNRGVPPTVCGTKHIRPPEAWRSIWSGTKYDFWAFGNLLFELATTKPVTGDFNRGSGELELAWMPGFPEAIDKGDEWIAFKDLVIRLLAVDPSRRLSDWQVVKEHPFFAGCDWGLQNQYTSVAPYEEEIEDQLLGL